MVRRVLRWLGLGALGIIGAALVALWAIDTGPGHRFVAERIAALRPETGLRIRIGRIDGSLWSAARLRDVRLSDPEGVFLESPEVALDWRPTAWLRNRLDIRALSSRLVILHRAPRLRRTARQGPILPGFDVRIARLDAHVRLEPGIAGQRRMAHLIGRADIHHGRALIDAAARAAGGDRLHVLLDAAPDRDRFDLDAALDAPSGGTVGGLLGTRNPVVLRVDGDGSWSRWRGKAVLDVAAHRTADLALAADAGRYGLTGMAVPAPLTQGKKARLSAPRVLVAGNATLADRQLDGRLSLRSAALDLLLHGRVDLGKSAFHAFDIDARLLKPEALFPNMTGRGVVATVRLDGPFRTARFAYRLTAPRMAFDQTGFEEVRATGEGRLSRAPVAVPVHLTARRVTGVGDVAGGILANLRVDGVLKTTDKLLTGEELDVRSDKLNSKLALLVDLVTGRYTVTLSGGLNRYLIPGLGLVDVLSELRVVPGPDGHGTQVTGRGRAWVRRFDNAFLAGLSGGLPQLDTQLTRGPDGVVHFANLVLTAPAIRITGSGLRRRDGSFQFIGGGNQDSYGAFTLGLDGNIARPMLDLLLAAPVPALGTTAVKLHLDPTPEGYRWTGAGGSTLGPFTAHGAILMPTGQPATVQVAALDVTGARAAGDLRSDPGGFTGTLDIAGGGLSGQLLFAPAGQIQRIETHLRAADAHLAGIAGLSVRRGALDGVILLDPAGVALDGRVTGQGMRRGPVSLARLDATARLRGGMGEVHASVAGSRGRAFALQTSAELGRDAVTLTGGGTVDGRPLTLTSPARFTRDGDGWLMAETGLGFSGGSARVSGRFGRSANRFDARLERMPLTVFDMGFPGLGLGGLASGHVSYAQATANELPRGRMELRISGLTRSGLVLSSAPVDLGLAGVLEGRNAAARAVVASGGKVIGRAQARLSPLQDGGDIVTRLTSAPLFAQLRYDGPADILWRLTGIETMDLSGPVAIGADMRGTALDPRIQGSLRTTDARLESAVSGTVITNLAATGRFVGSRLVVDRYTGATRDNGQVSGRATFDLAARNGLGLDIAMDARAATLLDRDDIGATVTGPLTFRSDGAGGVIGGDVTVDRGHFRLGRAVAATVPRLAVTEINRPADEAEVYAPPVPWTLDLKARARNRMAVTGLGLDSEWRTDLAIKGTVSDPQITGRADMLRGTYDFAGRRFDIDRGMIRFTGSVPVDPVVDIVAQANIQGVNASIRVSGTGLHPQIDFTSVPAMPEDELLSRLLFGSSITDLSAPEAVQLAAAVASLRDSGGNGLGLDPINAVRRAIRLDRLRILPADVTTGQHTSVAAGKYIGRRTYVELITDGQGYSATRVEFRITRWLSLLSTLSTIGRQSANVRISRDY